MTLVTGAALVTGGAKRLGRAMALELAELGLDVVIHYASSQADAEAAAEAVRAKGVSAAVVQADLLDRGAVAGLVGAATEAIGGPLGVLVNNASIFEPDEIRTASATSWDRHMGSNLYAPLFLSQAFAAQVPGGAVDQNGEPVARAAIVNMIDMRVRKPTPDFMTYGIAKAGLWWLTQTSAQALGPDIRVNGIGPGPTLIGSRQRDEHFAAQRAATVLNRGANPEDITGALRFILENEALTGQLLCIDGGQHLAWETPDVMIDE